MRLYIGGRAATLTPDLYAPIRSLLEMQRPVEGVFLGEEGCTAKVMNK